MAQVHTPRTARSIAGPPGTEEGRTAEAQTRDMLRRVAPTLTPRRYRCSGHRATEALTPPERPAFRGAANITDLKREVVHNPWLGGEHPARAYSRRVSPAVASTGRDPRVTIPERESGGPERGPRLSRSDPNWDTLHRPIRLYRAKSDPNRATLNPKVPGSIPGGGILRERLNAEPRARRCVPPPCSRPRPQATRRPPCDQHPAVSRLGLRERGRGCQPLWSASSSPSRQRRPPRILTTTAVRSTASTSATSSPTRRARPS